MRFCHTSTSDASISGSNKMQPKDALHPQHTGRLTKAPRDTYRDASQAVFRSADFFSKTRTISLSAATSIARTTNTNATTSSSWSSADSKSQQANQYQQWHPRKKQKVSPTCTRLPQAQPCPFSPPNATRGCDAYVSLSPPRDLSCLLVPLLLLLSLPPRGPQHQPRQD